jgi:hypothetical protein
MRSKRIATAGAVVLVLATSLAAKAIDGSDARHDKTANSISGRPARPAADSERRGAWPLKIRNVRLEPAPPTAKLPSTILKFDMLNEGSKRLTDFVLEISIVEKRELDHGLVPRRVLAGPFTMRGHVVLESGYSIDSQMLLRNLSPDCSCVALIEVLSARALSESGS